jgi:polysaccharide biosynthesis transport protein
MPELLRGDPDSLAPVGPPADVRLGWADAEALRGTVHLNDLIWALRRHLRLILAVAALAVAATGYLAYRVGPMYRAVAVIRLSDPRRSLTGGVVDDPADRAEARFAADPLLSQVQLLSSRLVAGAVVDSMPTLRVQTRPFRPGLVEGVVIAAARADSFPLVFDRDSFRVLGPSGERRGAYGASVTFDSVGFTLLRRPEARQGLLRVLSRDAAISRLIAHLRVAPRRGTDIVDVAYSAPDAVAAQQVVNRVVETFRTTSADAAQRQSRLRREFLETQLRVNDSLLAEARQALTAFHGRARAYGSRGFLAPEQTGLAGLELERGELAAERQRYVGLLAVLQDSSGRRRALQTAVSIPAVGASPAVTQLNTTLFQYETTRDSLANRSARHPDLPRLNQLIAATEVRLLRAVQAGLQSAVTSLDGRLAAMNDLRARHQQLSTTEAEEARLTERVEDARKVADELRIEYQKARIAEAVTVGQVEIVDHALVPLKPIGLGLAEQLALGLVVGLVLGGGGALLSERWSGSIARRVQVEHLGLPVLGIVPRCGPNTASMAAQQADAVVEAFRGIRLNLMNAHGGAPPVVVTVTSPGMGDGKSFVSANLALAFACANHRTLLVDADLRRGGLHRALHLRRTPGLTDFLAGDASREAIVQPTTHPALDFLPGGSRRRDAPELIGSGRMADLVTGLRSRYAVLVLDSPPLAAGVDAFVLSNLTGNLVLVLRLGRTDRELAEANLEVLRRHPTRLLGAILNDVRHGSEYRAYGYYLEGYESVTEPVSRPLIARGATPQSPTGRRHS